jgi:hypothetical protein
MLQFLVWLATLCHVPEELNYCVFSVVLRFCETVSFVLSGCFSRDMLMLIRVGSIEITHILPRHFIFNLVMAKDIVASHDIYFREFCKRQRSFNLLST